MYYDLKEIEKQIQNCRKQKSMIQEQFALQYREIFE